MATFNLGSIDLDDEDVAAVQEELDAYNNANGTSFTITQILRKAVRDYVDTFRVRRRERRHDALRQKLLAAPGPKRDAAIAAAEQALL